MTTWNVYIEFEGFPLYVDIDLDDDEFESQDEVWQYVLDNIIIEATKED